MNSITITLNSIRPRLFSRSPGPDARNQNCHQPIEMKLCLSYYSHENMPDAKFESGSLSVFGDIMSQNFPLKKGKSH